VDGHLGADLAAHALDALAPAERARAERHLAVCPECATALASHREILRALAASAPEPPAVHWGAYRAGLRARLAARRNGRSVWRRWRVTLVPLTAGLAVALLFLTIHGVGRRAEPRDVAAMEETLIGRHLELIREAPVVEHLELLEDLEIIRQLDRVAPRAEG
jgi:anti-sigma factor RsiW